jgi:ribosome biogenesis GTPase
MRPYVEGCRFSGCTHLHEPGCAVRAAVAASAIAAHRYDSYVKLYAEAAKHARVQGRARKGRTMAGILG